jgi:hypothetical protein
MVELYLHFPIHLRGLVLNKLSSETTLHIPPRKPVVPTEAYLGLSQVLQATRRIVPQIIPPSFPSTSLPVHYSLAVLSFGAAIILEVDSFKDVKSMNGRWEEHVVRIGKDCI